MDAVKDLLEIIKGAPQMALWVLVIIYVYKVTIVGSVYGVIRYVVNKWHSYATTPKTELLNRTMLVKSICISEECFEECVKQIERLKGISNGSNRDGWGYIHSSDVVWLKQAIDEKLEREKKK